MKANISFKPFITGLESVLKALALPLIVAEDHTETNVSSTT
jgi:hypothetical protein